MKIPVRTFTSEYVIWVPTKSVHRMDFGSGPKKAHYRIFGPIGIRSESRPGVIEIDREQRVLRFADLSDDPERWSQTISELEQAVRISHVKPASRQPRYAMPDAMREALKGHLHEEFRAFMRRHAKTPRVAPKPAYHYGMSDEEREMRERNIRENLEREPHWGQLMERRWPELANPK